MPYSLNIVLTNEEYARLQGLAVGLDNNPSTVEDIRLASLLKHICHHCVRTNDTPPVKTYVPQRLVAFRASLATLPPETEVRLDSDGSPAGWTYSARDNAIYIHK